MTDLPLGGPVSPDSTQYLSRPLVDHVRDAILRGDDVNLVGGWQTGKTTTLYALRMIGTDLGWATSYVDMLGWGNGLEEPEWYANLGERIRSNLLPAELQALQLDELNGHASLARFLVTLVGLARPHQPVVLMLDEVVAVPPALQRSFFSAIRALQNQRREPSAARELRRLSFVFAGTFSPELLIADSHNSPFNISRTLNTARHDFTLEQVRELVDLTGASIDPAKIFDWSAGHPYLTNALIEAVKQQGSNIDAAVTELVVHDRHFENLGRALGGSESGPLRRALRLMSEGPVPYVPGFDRDMEMLATAGLVRSDNGGNAVIRCKLYTQFLVRAGTSMQAGPRLSAERSRELSEPTGAVQLGPRLRVDVAIVAALQIELEAFLSLMLDGEERTVSLQPLRTYFLGKSPGGRTIVAARALAAGPLTAANLVRDLTAVWEPTNLILIGIAGGVRGAELGDVVVSSQLINYEGGKLVGGGVEPRPQVYRSAPELIERVLGMDPRSLPRTAESRPDGRTDVVSRIILGDVLSGSKVIADKEALETLTENWTQVRAVEMESSGIAATLSEMPAPPKFLMVKGICDKADESKSDDWHAYASSIAAAVAMRIIDSLRE